MRNEWQPHRNQQVLEPAGGESVDALIHAVGVIRQAESATGAHVAQQFLERREQSYELLVDTTEEHRTRFLGEDRRVLGWKGEASAGGFVLEVACVRHGPEPLAHVPLVRRGARRQVGTGAGAVAGPVRAETQAVAGGGHGGGRETDSVANDFADEGIGPGLIERAAWNGLF